MIERSKYLHDKSCKLNDMANLAIVGLNEKVVKETNE